MDTQTVRARPTIKAMLADRPWIKPVAGLAAWLISIFGLTATGTAMLGRAVLLGSFIAALVFGVIGLADRLSAAQTAAHSASPSVADIVRSRQRSRSIAIALALGGMVLLFYIATLVRLGGNVFNRGI